MVTVAARKATADCSLGTFGLRASVEKVEHGEIKLMSQGLLLRVSAQGTAQRVLA